MSKVEVNQVTQQCGTTLTVGGGACKTAVVDATTVTLGRCGGTVSLASGATQTGFGRTGTVDWDTSIKTGTVTAVTGKGYFVDTTSGGITVNLPAGVVGSIVAVSDYASTSASNNITVEPNGSEKINGVNDGYTMSTAGLAVTLVYADATRGWKSVTGSDADATGVVPVFITATGGTPCAGATCGDYKVHTFTGPGTFCVSCAGNSAGSNTTDYLVVAGGGGGGKGTSAAAGAGAGGMRFSATTYCSPSPLKAPAALPVSAIAYPITVGSGGASQPGAGSGNDGNNSIFSSITSTNGGGGGGGGESPAPPRSGRSGGSGGGGSYQPPGPGTAPPTTAGTGNTPPVSPSQGNTGGAGGPHAGTHAGGGGGGMVGVGAAGINPQTTGGCGGAGLGISITGSCVARAGGGGGGIQSASPDNAGVGGTGGGGGGGSPGVTSGVAGTVNTGGGGGGSGPGNGGAGGSGIVVIRYKFQ